LTSLVYLYCNHNSIVTLDVSALTSLTALRCHSNSITTLDVSNIAAAVSVINAKSNGMNQAAVDQILLDLYTDRMAFTFATPVLDIGGTNAAPSGIYQPACPPGTGHEYEFELENDSCGDGFNTWTITAN
jgi:Leucine-rich repeat (LRR) protein